MLHFPLTKLHAHANAHNLLLVPRLDTLRVLSPVHVLLKLNYGKDHHQLILLHLKDTLQVHVTLIPMQLKTIVTTNHLTLLYWLLRLHRAK
jgi:hypothetical protein